VDRVYATMSKDKIVNHVAKDLEDNLYKYIYDVGSTVKSIETNENELVFHYMDGHKNSFHIDGITDSTIDDIDIDDKIKLMAIGNYVEANDLAIIDILISALTIKEAQ
jgi:hypothetical protein